MCAEVDTVWNGNYVLDLELTPEQIAACSHPGPCDADVERVCAELALNLDTDAVRDEVRQTGAYSDEELADDAANLRRLVWMAACDLAEELG